MKILKTFLITWAFTTQAGLPPTTLSGDQQATKPTTFTTTVPNSQATQVAGVKSRIETGNTNLLVNPSFEHSTVTTGWIVTNATASANLTDMVEGKKDLSLALTAALTVTQDSTVNAANLVGLQGVASINIKTSDVTGLKVCARNAGVTSTTLCVSVPADGTWKNIIIPFIMTATSNGIAITSTGITGTVKIDDAFVGTSAPFQNVNSESVFSAKVSSTGTVSDESGDFINGNCALATATFTCTFSTSFFAVAPNCQITTSDGSTGWNASSAISSTQVVYTTTNSAGAGAAHAVNISCQKQGRDVPLASRIYSQSSQDYDWITKTTTLTNFGTSPTITCKYRRNGGSLDGQCFGITGTTPTGTASLTLPDSLAIDTNRIIASNTTAAAGQKVGTVSQQGASLAYSNVVTATGTSTTLLYFGNSINGTVALIPGNPFNNGVSASFAFSVPISGWSDYGTIVGSFAGIEKCANDYECTDTFSAQVSAAGVVSNENLDWISGNCTVANPSVCTLVSSVLKDGSSGLSGALNCTISAVTTRGYLVTSTTSAVSVTQFVTSTNATEVLSFPFTLKCQKGSQDYKPKTAKVASSIGVPTVPGLAGTTTAVDTFSVSYGATISTVCATVSTNCAYLDQIGTMVSNIFHGSTTGLYTMNLGRTYTKLKCSHFGIDSGAFSSSVGNVSNLSCSSCNSLTFTTLRSSTGAVIDSFGTLICQGTY